MIKKKNKVNIPLILCSIFITVISCFVCFNINKADNNTAYADSVSSVYSFTGSNIVTPVVLCSFAPHIPTSVNMGSFQFSFSINSDSSVVNTSAYCYLPFEYQSSEQGFIDGDVINPNYSVVMNNQYHRTNILFYYENNSSYSYVPVWFKVNNPSFNSNIYKVVYGSSYYSPLSDLDISSNVKYNYIQYYDTNENYISIVINSYETNFDLGNDTYWYYLAFTSRIYYINNPDNFSDNDFYNSGYSAGYETGYSSGSLVGNSNGYDSGYKAGQTVGYNAGFSDGAETTNQYTFLNLMSSVVDAPLTYFRSLFNFEILGMNLQNFLLGLFTLCIIVTIVRMCLGR